jgi:hypothetical protein
MIKTRNFVTFYKFLSQLDVHHTPNPKVLNDLKPTKEQLENGGIMKEVNDLRLQIDSKKKLSCIDPQGKSFNTNIAKVQAHNVVFCPLDDIELVDWTSTNKFARLWFCEDIHHSSILKLAIKKAIQKSTYFCQASCFKMIQMMKKKVFLGLCLHTKRAHCCHPSICTVLLSSILICRRTQL